MIATDPPYGIEYASSWMTRHDGTKRHMQQTFGKDEIQLDWLQEVRRVLKPTGAMYLFTRWDVAHIWKQGIEIAGLNVTQRIVWDKSHWGSGDLRYYGSQTEDILFCANPSHVLHWQKREGNVWKIWKGHVWKDGAVHPTQKPKQLMTKIIQYSSHLGDLVIDPFGGSGTTADAARGLGRKWITCDISREYCDLMEKRLAQPYTLPLFAQPA